MRGAYLPGDRRVDIKDVPDPAPGYGQVVVAIKASSICGSDLRCIYRAHTGVGEERYQNVIAGHEPAGEIVAVGPGVARFKEGDRVCVYHIAGCGQCHDCRSGYFISCTSPQRAAYGWQRDGGHANYMLADESTCVLLPDGVSYMDGALVACGTGTAYQALVRADVSGRDAVLVTGMGPVGMSVGMLAKAMGAPLVIGVDVAESRLDLARKFGCIDEGVTFGDDALDTIKELTRSEGCQVSVDASGNAAARSLALNGTRRWGRCVMVGEGGDLHMQVSEQLIHRQITMIGSWVTSVAATEDLVERLARWELHPDRIVTDRFALEDTKRAYDLADRGEGGKVAIVFD